MRVAIAACAAILVASGIGLLRSMEWARVSGAIVCLALAVGSVVLFRSWTFGGLLVASGIYLALPSTKLAVEGIRMRNAPRGEKP